MVVQLIRPSEFLIMEIRIKFNSKFKCLDSNLEEQVQVFICTVLFESVAQTAQRLIYILFVIPV